MWWHLTTYDNIWQLATCDDWHTEDDLSLDDRCSVWQHPNMWHVMTCDNIWQYPVTGRRLYDIWWQTCRRWSILRWQMTTSKDMTTFDSMKELWHGFWPSFCANKFTSEFTWLSHLHKLCEFTSSKEALYLETLSTLLSERLYDWLSQILAHPQ